MDDAKRRIAVLEGMHHNSDGEQVVDLIERLILIEHFLINAEKMLGAPVNLRLNSRIVNISLHIIHQAAQILVPLALTERHILHQLVVRLRLEIF